MFNEKLSHRTDARSRDIPSLNDSEQLIVGGFRTVSSESLYSFEKPKKLPEKLVAVPYYTWGNREENQMRVWMPY